LIGLEPATYVRPHVHSEQWEMIVLLRGCSLLSPLLQIAVNTECRDNSCEADTAPGDRTGQSDANRSPL
jgi:hypothetical protein